MVHRIAVTKDSTVILAQTAVPAVKAGLSAKTGQKVPATALHRQHASAMLQVARKFMQGLGSPAFNHPCCMRAHRRLQHSAHASFV